MGRWVGLLVALVLTFVGSTPSSARADCAVEFGLHMLALRADIGDAMGQPLGCEQALDPSGDTIQATSTGTAWYTIDDSASIFSDGYHRWELDRRGLLYWGTPDAVPLLLDGLADGP